MFGIGFQEMLVILVVVLIFFGPKRLPDLAKSLGKGIAEFKKASEEVRQGIQEAMKEETPPAGTGPDAASPNAAAQAGEPPSKAAGADEPKEPPAAGAPGGTGDRPPAPKDA